MFLDNSLQNINVECYYFLGKPFSEIRRHQVHWLIFWLMHVIFGWCFVLMKILAQIKVWVASWALLYYLICIFHLPACIQFQALIALARFTAMDKPHPLVDPRSGDDALDESSFFPVIGEPRVIDPGPPQPDDDEKMDWFLKSVNQDVEAKKAWGGADVPADGFPEDDPRKMMHKHTIRFLLMRGQPDMSEKQALRLWDKIQDKYNFWDVGLTLSLCQFWFHRLQLYVDKGKKTQLCFLWFLYMIGPCCRAMNIFNCDVWLCVCQLDVVSVHVGSRRAVAFWALLCWHAHSIQFKTCQFKLNLWSKELKVCEFLHNEIWCNYSYLWFMIAC